MKTPGILSKARKGANGRTNTKQLLRSMLVRSGRPVSNEENCTLTVGLLPYHH